MKDIKRIIAEAKPLYLGLFMMSALSIILSLVGLTTPWLYRELINFLTGQPLSPFFASLITADNGVVILLWLVAISFALDLIELATEEIRYYFIQITGTQSLIHFARKTLKHLHQLSVSYFDKTSPGWIRERVFGGINEFFGILRSIIADIAPLVINLIIASVVLFIFDPTLAIVFIVIVPPYVIVSIWRARTMRFWQKKIRSQFEQSGKTFYENIGYYQLIREFSREKYELSRLDKIYDKILKLRQKQEYFLRWTGALRSVLRVLAFMWVYGYGGYLVLSGQLLVGDLVLFIAYLNRAIEPLGRVMMIYDSIQVGLVSVSRIFKLWDQTERIPDEPDAKNLKVDGGGIEFKNVSFVYKGSQKHKDEQVIFKNFNLKINPREIVALVGPSGVGKSTLVKLLLRFYDINKGQILVDGQDIKTVKQKSLRQQVSVVMQDVITFNNTIKYNLCYGRPQATDKEIVKASRVANLFTFIAGLRKKFNTKIGERGVRLSGGEKQRLAIARALLKDAPILVMDEATSALDSENEKKIQDAMWELIKGRTAIIIAHRLSTVKRADKIVVLEGGKIIEQGSHKQLMKKSGYYRRLFKMQGEMLAE